MLDAFIMFCIYAFGLILIVGVPLKIWEHFDEKKRWNWQRRQEQSVKEYSMTHRNCFDFSVNDMKEPEKENKQTVIYKSHLLNEVVVEKTRLPPRDKLTSGNQRTI